MKIHNAQLGKSPNTVRQFIVQIVALVLAYALLSNIGLWVMGNFEPIIALRDTAKGKLFFVFLSLIIIHIILAPLIVFVTKRKYISLALPDGTLDKSLIHKANIFAILLFLFAEPFFLALSWPQIYFTFQEDITAWLIWILPFLVIIFIQVTAEEFFFRGYLAQYIAKFTNKRVWYIGLPALLWALPHWANMSGIHLQIPFLIFIFTLGCILGAIADRTQSLVFPIALHFFFNVFTACIYGNSLRSSAMLLIRAEYSELPLSVQSGYYLLTTLALLIIYLLLKKRF